MIRNKKRCQKALELKEGCRLFNTCYCNYNMLTIWQPKVKITGRNTLRYFVYEDESLFKNYKYKF